MIQSVKRVFEILEYISANGNLVRLSDIVSATGLQNTTIHNYLNTLKELGYLEQDDTSPRYRISSKINELSQLETSLSQLKSNFRPLLKQLSSKTNETAYLAVQMGNYFRYELKSEPERAVRIALELGKEIEMRHTAIGKVFMAYSSDLMKLVYKALSLAEIKDIEREIATIKNCGFALDIEQYEADLNCIAVPYIQNKKIVAVVGISGPSYRFTKEKMIQLAEELQVLLQHNLPV